MEKIYGLAQGPFTKDGKRLALDAGKVLRSKNGERRATDGPYSERKR